MPQLDISTFPSQFFWFLIFFSFLFFVVSYLFLPSLERIIYYRNKKIIDSFNNSLCILRLAEDMVNKHNLALQQAKIQVKKIMDDTMVQVEEMRSSVQNVLKEQRERMSQVVEEEIKRFKAENIDDLKKMSVSIALIYYAKLTNSNVKEELVIDLMSEEF